MWWNLALAGVIEGAITGPDGSPERDALVVAYDTRYRFVSGNTDAEGAYRLEGLPDDALRVRVIPRQSSPLAERWAGDTLIACDAQRFTPGDATARVDVALRPGPEITGVALRADGSPLVDEVIRVMPTWHREVGVATRVARTDAEGAFLISGLVEPPAGRPTRWLVEVEHGSVPNQFFDGAWTEDGASAVVIPEDGSSGVDLGAFDVLDGVTLSGVVRGPDGPVSGGQVSVSSPRRTVNVPIAEDGTWVARAVHPGPTLVWATSPGLARTYWPDADRPGERLMTSEPGEEVVGVEIVMPPESRVRGQVVGSGDLTTVSALWVNDDGSVALSAGADEAGTFLFPAVRAGSWTLEVFGASAGLIDGAIRGDDGERVVFDVPEGGELDLGRLTLPAGARFEGRATTLGSGRPVYGAAVIAERTGDAVARRLAFTDVDGWYQIPGLTAGSWKLEIVHSPYCPADPGWVALGWPGVIDPALGGRVDLAPGQVFTWDPVMPPDDDHDGMDDLWEIAHGLDPTVDDSGLDPDGDGFTNLEEYRLGTHPTEIAEPGCGCAGQRAALWLVGPLGFGLTARRRRRVA